MRSLTVGGQPAGYEGDAHYYALMRVLVAARAAGPQAIRARPRTAARQAGRR